MALYAHSIPKSYKNATLSEEYNFWKPGIDRGHDCLLNKNIWSLVKKVQEVHVLPCKYIFRVKNDAPKGPLIVLGCKQLFGIKYNQKFAPVVKFTSCVIRIRMRANGRRHSIPKWGPGRRYLHANTRRTKNIPENQDVVCKLNKALYGLKQAPRQWQAMIREYLMNVLKFKSNEYDPRLHIRRSRSDILVIALYVEDLLSTPAAPSATPPLFSEYLIYSFFSICTSRNKRVSLSDSGGLPDPSERRMAWEIHPLLECLRWLVK